MKRALFIFMFATITYGQVFNTAQTLKRGTASLGINPVVYTGGNDFALFLYGGYGLQSGFDIRLKAGFGQGETYLGADLEWILRGISPYISFTGGAHIQNDAGLDFTLNFTFPVRRSVQIFTGFDADMIFGKKTEINDQGQPEEKTDIRFPGWIFVGVDIGLRRNMVMILEVDFAVAGNASHIFGGGLNFYF